MTRESVYYLITSPDCPAEKIVERTYRTKEPGDMSTVSCLIPKSRRVASCQRCRLNSAKEVYISSYLLLPPPNTKKTV